MGSKRLTHRLPDGRIEYAYTNSYHLLQRLCELEDKIESGTLVELPCKVGDTVRFETYVRGVSVGICDHEVVGFNLNALVKRADAILPTEVPLSDFGKDVFISGEKT